MSNLENILFNKLKDINVTNLIIEYKSHIEKQEKLKILHKEFYNRFYRELIFKNGSQFKTIIYRDNKIWAEHI